VSTSVDARPEELVRPFLGQDSHALRRLSRTSQSFIGFTGRIAAILAAVLVTQGVSSDRLVWVAVATAIWVLSIQISLGRYASELQALGPSASVLHGTVLGLITTLAASAIAKESPASVWSLILTGVLVFAFVALWATVFRRFIATPKKIIIVGTESAGRSIAEELRSAPHPSFEAIGFVSDDLTAPPYHGIPNLGPSPDLPEITWRMRPDIVVLALDHNRPAVFAQLLESAKADFRVVEAAQFCEHAFGHVPVRDVTRAWFVSVLHLYQRPYSRFSKRVFDVVGASVGLLVAAPVLLPAIAMLALSRGPVIYRQERVGEHGETFTMYKLRTMRENSEEPGRPQWAREKDPRVTKGGKLMRRLRIDELPQLWNVLRGEMSIVGPRPERPEFMKYLEETVPFWSRRQLVKPGITGWGQIRLGYTANADESSGKLSYDLWYLRHRSLAVDFWICLQTVGVILTGDRRKVTV
jgi:exopolysaccharide biosynthesis polyprenyl glycosylphosphotransferase